ncbi:hypothetical protein PRIPAC_77044 [Pristionchus pacificus]|uniref:G protein-coupled receptor n=1 Tax=Pristionchus pacificus TaxID=54126 RepID=A0A2A6CMW6_PRIPA|nr:hypothetical protein PRIPAC_77044 [Pristionchus pacificus]|eukprot:PDM79585.1 G protein-coupled receptor [Pristionchus pacificus]
MSDPFLVSIEVQESFFLVLRIIFCVSIVLHSISMIFLIKLTPPNQGTWRNYMLFVQGCLIAIDVYMEMLFVMVPLFPAPCGYCTGPLCKIGVPLQIQTKWRTVVQVSLVAGSIFPPTYLQTQSVTDEMVRADPRNLTWIMERGCYICLKKIFYHEIFVVQVFLLLLVTTIWLVFMVVLIIRQHLQSFRVSQSFDFKMSGPYFVSIESQQNFFFVLRIISCVSMALHFTSLIFLIKFTPKNLTTWRNYKLFVQGCLIAIDVYMEMLFVMVLLFPAPCGYCVGPLCKLGVPLQIQTVGVYGDVGIETIIPGNRLRSVGIPQHIDSLLCIASSSIHFRFCQPFSIRKSRFLIIVSTWKRVVHFLLIIIPVIPNIYFSVNLQTQEVTDETVREDPRNLTWIMDRGCYFCLKKIMCHKIFVIQVISLVTPLLMMTIPIIIFALAADGTEPFFIYRDTLSFYRTQHFSSFSNAVIPKQHRQYHQEHCVLKSCIHHSHGNQPTPSVVPYETVKKAVCERVGQELAQLKNLNSLKLCCLGFLRMRMTMGIVIFHIDVPLAPDGVTSKTVFPDSLTVISIEFYLGSQTRLIFAFILTEEFWKNCFRRHAVWSQRDVDMKNDYAHRHLHPREP